MKSPFDGNIDKTSGDFQLRISLENCFAYGGYGVMRVLVIPDILLMLRGQLCQSSKNLRTALRVRHRST